MASPADSANDATLPPAGLDLGVTEESANPPRQVTEGEDVYVALLALRLGHLTETSLLRAVEDWRSLRFSTLPAALQAQGVRIESLRELYPVAIRQVGVWGSDLERWLQGLGFESGQLSELLRSRSTGNNTRPSPGLEATILFDTAPGSTNVPANVVISENQETRYQIVKLHAEGGLGRVMLAKDRELDRDVALKEIKPRYADDEICRMRFELEAQITGRLQHPGIVPVYGLGRYADGRPFYAMRFIRGQSLSDAIKEYYQAAPEMNAARRSLQFRNLLRRFFDVCHVIEFAHTHGVLHRDLKPANIMLGRHGETMVVDWGLAKSLDDDQADESILDQSFVRPVSSDSAATSMGSIMGTLGFMSPEQASGDPTQVSKSADIYSLGATLYVLLTNQVPHSGSSREEVLGQIRAGQFPRPSEIRAVSAPLEAICLKAMALRSEDRYATAGELGEDIEAWLADEPVAARPDSRIEAALRWLRHHQGWAVSGTAAALIAAIAMGTAAFLVHRASQETQRQRAIAVARYRDAREAIDGWRSEASDLLSNFPGVLNVRRRLLTAAADDYDRLAAEPSGDSDLELERATAWLRLGDVRRELEDLPAAREAYEKCEALLVEQGKRDEAMSQWEVELGRVRLRQAGLLDFEDPLEAESLLAKERERLMSVEKRQPALSGLQEVLGAMELNRAGLLIDQDRLAEARELLAAAGKRFVELQQADGNDSRSRRNAAQVQLQLGSLDLRGGDAEAARQHFAAALEQWSALVDAEPDNPRYLVSRADARVLLGNAFRRLGMMASEAQAYETATDDYAQAVRAVPDNPLFQESLALTRVDLAQLDILLGRMQRAVEVVAPAEQLAVLLASNFPEQPRFREIQSAAEAAKGQALRELGKAEATQALQSAAERLKSLVEDHPDVKQYQIRYAVCLKDLALAMEPSEPQQARNFFERAITLLEQLAQQAPETPVFRVELAHCLNQWGETLLRSENTAEGMEVFGRARRVWKSLIGEQSDAEQLREAAWFLANCRAIELRSPKEALAAAERACEQSAGNWMTWMTVAAAHLRLEDNKSAKSAIEKAQSLAPHPDPRLIALTSWANATQGEKVLAARQMEEAQALAAAERPGSRELAAFLAELAGLIAESNESNNSGGPKRTD